MLKVVLLDPHPVVQKGFKAFFKKNTSILIYTYLPQSIYGISLLKAGALGYLSKQVKKKSTD